jgi:hypothetical protein
MTERGDRLENPYLNNIGSFFGGGYLGCGDQEDVFRDQLSKQIYEDTWTFVRKESLWHRWGEAHSSNPNDPVIIYDPWNGTIEVKHKK